MSEFPPLERFISKIDGFIGMKPREKTDYLAYWLTTTKGEAVMPTQIAACFETLDLTPFARLSPYLSEEATKPAGKYVKKPKGYRLERGVYESIKREIEDLPERISVSQEMLNLIDLVKDSHEKSFLSEAIDCYRVKANRATITLVWALTIDHLQRYIFANKLSEFNAALAANPDRRVTVIVNYSDFSDLPENKLIELSRSTRVVTNDQRKILDEKLGIRNSAAHPSGINFSSHKATEFCLDLIPNIVLAL